MRATIRDSNTWSKAFQNRCSARQGNIRECFVHWQNMAMDRCKGTFRSAYSRLTCPQFMNPCRSITTTRRLHVQMPIQLPVTAFTASHRRLVHRVHLNHRSLSSIPPSTEKNAAGPLSKSLEPPPPPPSKSTLSSCRKPKVELRPGPVKSTDPNHDRPTPTPPTVKPHHRSSTSPRVSSTTSVPSSTSSHASSVIETTKRDFDDATKHGILAPPPPGASRFRQIFHQAKELIVRIVH
jgi:hypothetical protein